jgi:hypothetical protein
MDRCPNCGATVRVGAKFCTTCGMRLPEPAAATSTTEESARSPFDSTSTVASRWPSRSTYGAAESSTTETVEEAPTPSSDESVEAVGETEPAPSLEPSEPVSTWGAWAPPVAPVAEEERPAGTAAAETESPSTWVASESASEEAIAEVASDEDAVAEEDRAEEAAATGWTRSGETDFLQLPEQPDPAAWKSIESQLAGSDEVEAVAEVDEDQGIGEAVVDEVEVEMAEAELAPSSPTAERAFELLDELRTIIAETAAVAVAAEAAEPVTTEAVSMEGARPSEPAVARFGELRAAVDAAREHPRDIDTMLDLSGRLDVIIELHDAFESLYQAAFGELAETTDEASDQE